MVKRDGASTKMKSTYYLKPGQTLENTKISDRSLALMLTKDAYNRFVDYTTENERMAAEAEKEAAKLAALKNATYEMSKSWDDTIANIKKRRKDELLNRRKREDEARARTLVDVKTRNAVERAKVVSEARKLLLWKRPQCRLINGAFLTSECYRQLNAQVAFNRNLRDLDKEGDEEYARRINKDVAKYLDEERCRAEDRKKQKQEYGAELRRQIAGIGNDLKRLEIQEHQAEKEELRDMAKELRMVENCEAEQIAKRKKELREMFVNAMMARKRHEMDVKRKDEFENRAIEVMVKAKDRIRKIGKSRMKQAMEEKMRVSELLAKKCMAIRVSRESEEEESRRRAIAEKERFEREKREAKKRQEETIRADMEKYREELAAIKEYQADEEKNLITWETLQRFKRDEYNRQIEQERAKSKWKVKQENAAYLRRQMDERETERKRMETMEDNSALTKKIIQSTNEKVLAYGEQVLKECAELNRSAPNEPARPLFPILKAIESFKKENGLIPPKRYEECEAPKKRRRRRPVCAGTVPADQIIYL